LLFSGFDCIISKNKKVRESKKMAKKHHNIGEIMVKIMAVILALLMIIAVAATLIYYLLH